MYKLQIYSLLQSQSQTVTLDGGQTCLLARDGDSVHKPQVGLDTRTKKLADRQL
jgi:hypothetical protein